MESLSHSKKNYGGNGGSGGYGPVRHKTVYDDVFGGPPKFGAPTLPPRLEDYTEIFQGFHASRGSSIPVLDLPPVANDDDDLWFDVQASKFDYSEVFGGFNGLDFAVSYEELFEKSNTLEDDSSEEAWTPAHSDSLSDESDPYASLEMNQHLSNADHDQSFGMSTQFKLSHNTGSMNIEKDVSNGMKKNHSELHDVPESSVFDNHTLLPRKMEKAKVSSQANNDHYGSTDSDFGKLLKKSQEGAREGKQLKKSLSQPLDGSGRFGNDPNHLAGHHKPDSLGSGPVFSLSGISLKTQPSQLPPPSRPPPALASKKEEIAGVGTNLKTSKSYCFERMAGESSPPYFDVEIDASSSAAASAAAMKDAVEQAQAKLRSAKELMEKKKDVLQSRSKLRMENDVEDKEGRGTVTNGRSSGFEGEGMKQLHEREGSKTRHKVREGRQKTETINTVTTSIEGEKNTNEVRNSIARKVTKEPRSSQGSDEIRATVASKEAPKFNEPVARKQVEAMEILDPNAKSRELRKNNKTVYGSFDQQEDDTVARTKEGCRLKENREMQEMFKVSHWEEEHLKKPNVALKACERSEIEKSLLLSQQHGEFKMLNEADENELYENLIEIQLKDNEMETGEKLVGVSEKVDTEIQLSTRRKGYHMASVQASDDEGYDSGQQEDAEQEHERGLKKTLRKDAKEMQPGAPEVEVINSEEKENHGRGGCEKGVEEPVWQEENKKRSLKTFSQKENDSTLEMVLEQVDNKSVQVLEHSEKILEKELKQEKHEKKTEEPFEQEENTEKQGNACETEESEQSLNHARGKEEIGKRYKLDCHSEENRKLQEDQEREESEKGEEAVLGNSGIENEQEAAQLEEDDRRLNMKTENHSRAVDEKAEASDGAYKVDDNVILQANGDIPRCIPIGKVERIPETPLCRKDGNPRSHWDYPELGVVKQIHDLGKERVCSTDLNQNDFQHGKDEVRMDDMTSSNHLHESGGKQEGLNVIEQTQVESDKTIFKRTTGFENANNYTHNVEGERMNVKGLQSGLVPEERKNSSTSPKLAEEWVEVGRSPLPNLVPPVRNVDNPGQKVVSQSMEGKDEYRYKTLSEDREIEEKLRRERELENDRLRKIEEERERERERELENDRLRKLEEAREKKRIEEERERKRIEEERERKRIEEERERKRERELENDWLRKREEERERQRERELENERLRKIEEERERRRERELEEDRLRKIEEERERQREREKDRMPVDRATLEARERPIAEARERAERAAVERATAEFRQRALAEARERLEKACAEARERSLSEKTSESRHRAERTAMEKAPVEASERAERSLADKYSASRSSGTRQSYLSTELPDSQFQKVGSYSGLRYSHTAAHNGGESESPQRCKARLERHQRTADRAAKALAEKNMRDLIAQKEQAERNRLAETLDAEVKRWSSGKQGNLRALLSTLQYILGPDSGWQPVPLTEVITTAAVKKAYRKATLCVHPDKLQQRGANIQQKYICEKVFDLLKEAWNRFNSEER